MISIDVRTTLVNDDNIPEAKEENTFSYRIPGLSKDSGVDFLIVAEDISDSPSQFGSDDFFAFEQQVNLKVMFPVDYEGDYDDLKLRIIKSLRKENFIFNSNPHGVQGFPDSQRRHMRLIFNRTQELNQ